MINIKKNKNRGNKLDYCEVARSTGRSYMKKIINFCIFVRRNRHINWIKNIIFAFQMNISKEPIEFKKK